MGAMNGMGGTCAACGEKGQACCPGANPCGAALGCVPGAMGAGDTCQPCGAAGEACCGMGAINTRVCDPGLTCRGGGGGAAATCQTQGGGGPPDAAAGG
jgi:hypothetical protein